MVAQHRCPERLRQCGIGGAPSGDRGRGRCPGRARYRSRHSVDAASLSPGPGQCAGRDNPSGNFVAASPKARSSDVQGRPLRPALSPARTARQHARGAPGISLDMLDTIRPTSIAAAAACRSRCPPSGAVLVARRAAIPPSWLSARSSARSETQADSVRSIVTGSSARGASRRSACTDHAVAAEQSAQRL
jgi:hypothetical protein